MDFGTVGGETGGLTYGRTGGSTDRRTKRHCVATRRSSLPLSLRNSVKEGYQPAVRRCFVRPAYILLLFHRNGCRRS
jgi:hypothetical protein